MFGNAGAKPPTDAGEPPVGSGNAVGGQAPIFAALSAVPPEPPQPTEGSVSLENSNSVGNWLDQLPERSWDLGPGE